MNRIWAIALGLVAGSFAIVFVTVWFMMITQGDAPWNDWNRSFSLSGIYVNLYVFLLLNAIALPALTLSIWRTLQLAGWLPTHQGVQWASNVLMGMGIACIVIVAIYFEPWKTTLKGEESPGAPSDERLNYPTFPLAAENDMGWELTAADGSMLNLQDLKGKAVFANIWATWCGFCILEFPNIQRLYDDYKDNPNVAFVLVSDEEPETVRLWLEGPGKEWKLPFYTTKEFPAKYRPGGYPTTYFIAPDGRTAFRHSGFVAWDGEKTRSFLTELARQPH